MIPGPSEPELAMNAYLSPLVEELKQGWERGFNVKTSQGVQVPIRIALTCIACDIPASRKVCGFLGHHASLACNKCFKKFSVQFGQGTDYSGFDRDNWVPRTSSDHRSHCQQVMNETTKSGIRKMESKYGVRFSVLLSLPYFDPIRFTAIDTMHNLYLGTGKHAFKVWISENVLTKDNLAEIDRRIRLFQVPSGVGRLPTNVSSNYGGFKAEQWRTWITVYSPVVLKGILPPNHLQCWLLFVRACTILGQRIIRKSDITTADLLLLNYCKRFEDLYGKEYCTINLHLHLHLKDTFCDFGPSHSFWCFPFERFNGILGSYPTNSKAVEVQFMKKFLASQSVKEMSRYCDLELHSLLPKSKVSSNILANKDDTALKVLQMSTSPLSSFSYITALVELLPPLHQSVFPSEMVQRLKMIYEQLFPNFTITNVSPFHYRCNCVKLGGDLLGSVSNAASAKTSAVITAFWPTRNAELTTPLNLSCMRVGVVQYYFKHQVVMSDENNEKSSVSMEFAYVLWKQKHPQHDWFGNSAIVCFDLFEQQSCCNFLPVQRIIKKCAFCLPKLEILPNVQESVFVACPISIKYTM